MSSNRGKKKGNNSLEQLSHTNFLQIPGCLCGCPKATLQCYGLCHVREHVSGTVLNTGHTSVSQLTKNSTNPYKAFILAQTHALKNILKCVVGEK